MIKVAIIGLGAIAPSHIKAYKELKDHYEIAALCDIYLEKAQQTAAEYGLNCEIYQDVQQLFARGDIDLVSICTPPYTHAELAISAMKAGLHVLVEKPMASSLEECDAMNRTAAETGKLLSVVAQNRFRTPMMKLKQVLDSQLIGQVVHAQVDSFWWRGHSYYDLWWRGTWEKEGGGCTLNHAVHHIDIFQWMNGMPQEVTALMSNTSHDNAEVEDLSIAVCRYNNDSMAQITSSVVHHGQEQQLIFQGKKARVSAPWKVNASISKPNGFPEVNNELEEKLQQLYNSLPELQYEGHTGQIYDIARAIKGEKPLLADGQQGRQTVELITAIYESASTGQAVKLPLGSSSSFYSREGIIKNAKYFYEKTSSVTSFASNEITTGDEK